MSRVIELRCWDELKKGYLDGDDILFQNILSPVNLVEGLSTITLEPRNDLHGHFILEQWTGLLDSGGKEIYEGDVVIYESEKSKFRCKVEWGGQWAYASFVLTGTKPWANKLVEFSNDILNPRYAENIEVIGNIHEREEEA